MGLGVQVEHPDDVPDAVELHRLVLLRNSRLDVDEQVALTARLGRVVGSEVDVPQVRYEVDRGRHPDHAFFNQQWHADLSWCEEGPAITVLCRVRAGRGAPRTAFVDTVSGFERLPLARRDQVRGWTAHHHVERSRVLRHGRGTPPPAAPLRRPPRSPRPVGGEAVPTYVCEPGAAHPVVVRHEPSGRDGVLLGDHAWTLGSCPEVEGRRLVEELQAEVVAAGERYVHRWRRGDLVVFDNRTVLHRREGLAHHRRRLLRRTVAWPRVS